jgi:hypothetical protein
MREYRLIDADCHVVEPPHIWERWLPKQFQDRAPRLVKDEEGGDAWEFVPGGPLMYIGLVATPGMRFEDIKWKGYTYDTVRRGCWEGKARLEDMDFDGVDAEFIYPSQRTMYYFMGNADREFHRAACAPTTTTWRRSSARPIPSGCSSSRRCRTSASTDAIAELERCREMGARGCIITAWPRAATTSRRRRRVLPRGGRHGHAGVDPHPDPAQARPRPTIEGPAAIASMALSGMLPVPADHVRADHGRSVRSHPEAADRRRRDGDRLDPGGARAGRQLLLAQPRAHGLSIRHLPSHYFRNNFTCTFIQDRTGIRNRHAIGIRNIAWSTDYRTTAATGRTAARSSRRRCSTCRRASGTGSARATWSSCTSCRRACRSALGGRDADPIDEAVGRRPAALDHHGTARGARRVLEQEAVRGPRARRPGMRLHRRRGPRARRRAAPRTTRS